MSDTLSSAQLATLRPLARAFGHGWACDEVGPTDQEILGLGVAGAVRAWVGRLTDLDAAEQTRQLEEAGGDPDRVEWLEAHPCTSHSEWRGLDPTAAHRSGSGTVRWGVSPNGDVDVAIHVAGHWPVPDDVGRLLWRLRVSGGEVRGENISAWPGDHERGCAQVVCRALGVSLAWVDPLPRPLPRPPTTPGPIRRL